MKWREMFLRFKLLLILFLLALLIVPVIPAAGGRDLSLPDALELGAEASFEIKKAKLSWENARLNYEKNKATNLLSSSRYSELQLELNLLKAEENYQRTRDQALLGIARGYLELSKTEQERAWRRKQVEWEEMSLNTLQKQVEQGYETRAALMRQENEYHSQRLTLKTVDNNYAQLLRELAMEIGWTAVPSTLELKPVNTTLNWNLSEEECLNLAQQNSLTLRVCALEVELAQVAKTRAEIDAVLAVERQELDNDLQLALLRQQEASWELENSVREQYTALTQLAENLALNQDHLATARANFQKVQQQQEVGLLKNIDRLAAEAELLQAEYQMLTAVTNYQLKKWEFQQLLGLDLEV